MTPQIANTPLRETVQRNRWYSYPSAKTSTKKKKKKKLFEYDKARLYPPVQEMTELELLRSGPMCKDCQKEHYGQVCLCNKYGWIHPHHGCLDRPFTSEEIPTVVYVPPEDSKTKEIKLTVLIKGKHWCWLCKSHGPEKVCPRKDEIGTEYGRQRLKELLQEMVNTEEKLELGEEKNGGVPKKIRKHGFSGDSTICHHKGEPVGPKIIQPPEGKKPHIKPAEVEGGAQWLTKPTSTPSKGTSSAGGQPPRKPTQGSSITRGSKIRDKQGGTTSN